MDGKGFARILFFERLLPEVSTNLRNRIEAELLRRELVVAVGDVLQPAGQLARYCFELKLSEPFVQINVEEPIELRDHFFAVPGDPIYQCPGCDGELYQYHGRDFRTGARFPLHTHTCPHCGSYVYEQALSIHPTGPPTAAASVWLIASRYEEKLPSLQDGCQEFVEAFEDAVDPEGAIAEERFLPWFS